MAGPFDLSVSMGLHGDWRRVEVVDAVTDIIRTATDAGLPTIMPVFAAEPAECRELMIKWENLGVTNFVIGSDKIIVAEAFASWTAALGR